MKTIAFALRGDHIPLDALLKATGLASSGGIAKRIIAAGEVSVDGQCELRKTRKIRLGNRIELENPPVVIDVGSGPDSA